jgi:hypothetical protein
MNLTHNLGSQSDHARTAPPLISPDKSSLYDLSSELATFGVAVVKNVDIVLIQRRMDAIHAQNVEILKRLEARDDVEGISKNLGEFSLKMGQGGNDDGAESGTGSLKRPFAEVSDDRRPGGSSHKRRKDVHNDAHMK